MTALSLRLHGGPEAAARARRALTKLRSDIDPPLMETLRLLVTELVSNSVRHAHSETVILKVLVGRSAVLTEVTDAGPGFDPASTPEPRHERERVGPVPRGAPRAPLGREPERRRDARLVRAAPRLEPQLFLTGGRLAQQGPEALRRRGRVVAAVVVERHVHLARLLGQ